ncbi:MAG: Wzz/FepE/Etk N-terminal domain-containing protein [Tunicatimonas sp.]
MKTEENDIDQLEAATRVAPRPEPDSESGQSTARRTDYRPSSSPSVEEDEIDLAELARQLWARRRVVWITMGVVFLIGLLVALVSPEEYEANVVLMPQSSDASGGIGSGLLRQFGGLASLGLGGAGGNSGGTLSPSLYPEITQSTPFFLDIMDKELYFATLDTTVNFTQYFGEIERPGLLDYLKTYTIGLPRLLINLPVRFINLFRDSPTVPVLVRPSQTDSTATDSVTQAPLRLTSRQRGVMNKLKERISTTIEENSTVKIAVQMPDPLVAAEATEMAADYLTNYILEYRTEKAQQDLRFIQAQHDDKKARYAAIQRRLARFRDRNMNMISETALIQQQQLEAENQLALGLYESLAQQLEQAKIKVQEETPVFKVLEPIQVPLSPSSPNRELILILSLFVGLFLGLGIVFLLILYSNMKQAFTTQ